jgi:hypothetical protein
MHFNDSRVGLHLVAGLVAAAVLSTTVAPAFAQGKKAASGAKAKPKGKGKKKSPDDEKRDQAREAYGEGEAKFKAEDYAGAAAAYARANDILPSPQAQFKVATALDKAGKTTEAVEAYEKFLATAPADKMDEQKTQAKDRVGALAQGSITVLSDPGNAMVKIDGTPAEGKTPLKTKIKPGKHMVEVSLADHETVSKEVEVTPNGDARVNVTLPSTAPPPPPPVVAVAPPPAPPEKPAEPPPSKTPAYVTLGLAGAGAIVGTIFGIAALGSKSDFDKTPTTKTADSAERNALISDMAFGAAVTLGVTGTVLYLNASKKQEAAKAASSFRIAPIVTPKTQGAAATFSF